MFQKDSTAVKKEEVTVVDAQSHDAGSFVHGPTPQRSKFTKDPSLCGSHPVL